MQQPATSLLLHMSSRSKLGPWLTPQTLTFQAGGRPPVAVSSATRSTSSAAWETGSTPEGAAALNASASTPICWNVRAPAAHHHRQSALQGLQQAGRAAVPQAHVQPGRLLQLLCDLQLTPLSSW